MSKHHRVVTLQLTLTSITLPMTLTSPSSSSRIDSVDSSTYGIVASLIANRNRNRKPKQTHILNNHTLPHTLTQRLEDSTALE